MKIKNAKKKKGKNQFVKFGMNILIKAMYFFSFLLIKKKMFSIKKNKAIIYVVDSSDTNLEDESIEEFEKLVKNELLKNAVILILANK